MLLSMCYNVFMSKENITFILAIIGSVGAMISGFRAFWLSRVNLNLKIDDCKRINHVTQFFILFENKSTNPISISEVAIAHDGKLFPCDLLCKKIRSTDAGFLYHTPRFPLNIPGATSQLHFLEFVEAPQIDLTPGKTVVLSLGTNRGRIVKTLSLPPPGRYLHSR